MEKKAFIDVEIEICPIEEDILLVSVPGGQMRGTGIYDETPSWIID